MTWKRKNLLRKTGLALVSLVLSILSAECLLRAFLYVDFLKIPAWRNPALYAGYSDDDAYWELHHHFDGEWYPNSSDMIHPVLGWSQDRIRAGNPLGLFDDTVSRLSSEKRKILFYGDSYVKGGAESDFQLPVFLTNQMKNTAVVDFSVGGYGLDQSYLMFTLTHEKARKPYILMVILFDDLDRSILSVRTYQKPYYVLENNLLKLSGVPVDTDPVHYLRTHPPKIRSYLAGYASQTLRRKSKSLDSYLSRIPEKQQINSAILAQLKRDCLEKQYPLEVVIFYDPTSLQVSTWQERFLKEKLEELQIPYFDTKPILLAYANAHNIPLLQLYDATWHHNNLGNSVLGQKLLEHLKNRGFE